MVSGGAGGSRRRATSERTARGPWSRNVKLVNSVRVVRVTSTSSGPGRKCDSTRAVSSASVVRRG